MEALTGTKVGKKAGPSAKRTVVRTGPSAQSRIERKYRRARTALLLAVLGYIAASCYYEMRWRMPLGQTTSPGAIIVP